MSVVQAEWARLLVESLATSGVTDAIISPGARSLPLVAAAHGCNTLRRHDILDERVAGFFALGQAKVTERPSLLVCTSGSAGAHYYPAMVEAAASGTPLIVATADRPPELHDCGAPQSVDQARYFGAHARWFCDVGLPSDEPEALRGLRRVAAQAVLKSTWPTPGPVHLNVPLRTPLEPPAAATEQVLALRAIVDEILRAERVVTHTGRARPDQTTLAELALACRDAERGLIVCGAGPLSQRRARDAVEALSSSTRFPILAEGASQMRFVGPERGPRAPRCDAFDVLLRDSAFVDRHAADLVLQIGAAPLSRPLERYLEHHHAGCRRWVISRGWHDPNHRASSMILGDVEEVVRALAAAVSARAPGGSWESAFSAADQRAWEAIDAELGRDPGTLSEGGVARSLAEALPRGALLALGSSLPIRHLDAFVRGDRCQAAVLAQRGANGIDGLISGAAGAASVHEGPVALLLGDAAFQHDLGGLAVARRSNVPLVVVVLNNRGGRIFEQLPIGGRADLGEVLEQHLVMTQEADLGSAAKTFGIGYTRVDEPDALDQALRRSIAGPGCTVIEAVVPPHGAAEMARRLGSVTR